MECAAGIPGCVWMFAGVLPATTAGAAKGVRVVPCVDANCDGAATTAAATTAGTRRPRGAARGHNRGIRGAPGVGKTLGAGMGRTATTAAVGDRVISGAGSPAHAAGTADYATAATATTTAG